MLICGAGRLWELVMDWMEVLWWRCGDGLSEYGRVRCMHG